MEKIFEQRLSNRLKFVFLGPESTGKTTLCKQLAAYYCTEWVPEYSREYLQDKWDRTATVCEPEDILPIAAGQIRRENELAESNKRFLVCDTSLFQTKVYSEYYYGYCDEIVEHYALKHRYDLYFLTYIDVAWEKDDLRDRPLERTAMFNRFKSALDIHKKPYIILKGDKDTRFKKAVKEINLLTNKKT